MNSEFNTRGNTRSNAIRNKNKTRKAQARPFIPVRPLSAAAGIGAANESKNSAKYGHLDYSTEPVDDKKLEEIEFDIWSPETGDYKRITSFDETGRYFIAQFTIFTQGGHLIYFVDNHGQKHRYARRGEWVAGKLVYGNVGIQLNNAAPLSNKEIDMFKIIAKFNDGLYLY